MSELFRIEQLKVHIAEGHLWKRKERTVLDDVSFGLSEGESVAYLGPNGAGKTTTFRAVCGLSTLASGGFYWQDKAVLPEEFNRHIGFMPEYPYFYRALTPRELLQGLGRLSRLNYTQVRQRIESLAEKLDFGSVLDQPIRTCSKGEMQKVSLAQAMLHEPKLLILDEPMSGLDPIGRERVRQVLIDANIRGTSLLFSSHILSDAERLCHKVVALNQGSIIYVGELAALTDLGGMWQIIVQIDGEPGKWPEAISRQVLSDGTSQLSGHEAKLSLHKALEFCLNMKGCTVVSASPARRRLEDAFVALLGKGPSHA